MTEYTVLLTIKIHKFPDYHIQVSKEFELSIHPNMTDNICVEDMNCIIEHIHYDLDTDSCVLFIVNTDGPGETEESEVAPRLKEEAEEMKVSGWILTEYDFCEKSWDEV